MGLERPIGYALNKANAYFFEARKSNHACITQCAHAYTRMQKHIIIICIQNVKLIPVLCILLVAGTQEKGGRYSLKRNKLEKKLYAICHILVEPSLVPSPSLLPSLRRSGDPSPKGRFTRSESRRIQRDCSICN